MGISRQGYYKRLKADKQQEALEETVITEVDQIRQKLPRVGTRKLMHMIETKIGRDHLFAVLRWHRKLVPLKRRYHVTTNSRHGYLRHQNLIKEKKPERPNEQYVSDITYVATQQGYGYLSLVTDRYSRLIVGYDFSRSLVVEGSMRALKMALKQRKRDEETIHHSDRGVQYSCHAYINCLKSHGVIPSMTQENHVYENGMAERVNGILKTEFGLNKRLKSYKAAKKLIQQSIELYNSYRPHMALEYKTPLQVHGGLKA